MILNLQPIKPLRRLHQKHISLWKFFAEKEKHQAAWATTRSFALALAHAPGVNS
jgi:hypothetical protein